MKGLEDRDGVAELSEVAGYGESRRTGSDDRDLLLPPYLRCGALATVAMQADPVSSKALQTAYSNRILVGIQDTAGFTLMLDRTHASADRRQQVAPADRGGGSVKVPYGDAANEFPYRHVDRAPELAERFLAVETAPGLGYRALHRIALGDLVPTPPPLFRVSDGHLRLVWVHDGHVAYFSSPASSQASFSCSL